MAFQINSQSLFLTYSQCPLPYEDFVITILEHPILSTNDGYAISQELHADGNTHYHALFHFAKPIRTKNCRLFDLGQYHPNVQPVRSIKHVYDYVTKHGNVFEDLGTLAGRLKRNGTSWKDALAAETYEEACYIVETNYPRDWVLSGDRIRANLRHKFPDHVSAVPAPTYDNASFTNVTAPLLDWVRDELGGAHERKKSLILYGPSRTGKTSWARSLGSHLYMMGRLDPTLLLSKMDESFVIFDDFNCDDIPKNQLSSSWKSFLGCQSVVTLRELYRNPKMIEWKIPTIWICNQIPEFPDRDFVNLNCIFVHVTGSLY